jgi:hypothetical protein
MVPLTAAGTDETKSSDLPNQTVQFALFRVGAPGSCSFCVQTHFGNSAGESTTSSTSSMKGRNSGNNGSDRVKNNILKPTFEELFLSRCEMTRQGTVLRDTTPIVFNKPEVTPKVPPDPSPSHNDIQSMINSVLERQAKSIDELLHRLEEERDGKKLDTTSVNPSSSTYAVSFTQTNLYTSGALAGDTSMPNPSAQPVNHFHSWTTNEGSALTFGVPQQTMASMFGQGYTQTTHSFSMPNFTSAHTPLGAMIEHMRTLAATTKN